MTGAIHPDWDELLAAVEAASADPTAVHAGTADPTATGLRGVRVGVSFDRAVPALRAAREHAAVCATCRREWERIASFLALCAERRSLPQPSRAAREEALRAVRERLAPRPLEGLRRIWAVRLEPVERPSLRGPGDRPSRLLFATPGHRIALTRLERDGRRILRGQVVPAAGSLPLSRAVHADILDVAISVDRFGEFVIDPLPEGLAELEIQLDDLVVQIALPPA